MKKPSIARNQLPTFLKTYSQIQNYLQLPIDLLQKVGDDEQASVLIGMQKNYTNKIFDYLRENNLQEIKINVSSTTQRTYSLTR
ncbi:hypothetical protein [Sulfuricurvum sp.]|uniref:hypothetical protein n=1 Tax=Sulfuricurvum sp. TaxID=2025608 RepID=UPI003562C653